MSSETHTGTMDEARNSPAGDSYSFRVDGISKSFRHVQALKDVSLEVNHGEVIGLVGENGAGKSTLLNILTGVLEADEGQLYVDGDSVTFTNPREAANYGVSLVHQEQDVITTLRGYENLYLGREKERFGVLEKEEMRESAQAFVDDLGIDIDVNDLVRDYTFNERQMLEIAKAFHVSQKSDNPVILLDEPTAGLEESGREILFDLVNDLRDRATFVFVSHELDEVLEISDRIYVLKDGEQVGVTDVEDATTDSLQRAMVGRETADEYYRVPDQRRESQLGDVAMAVDSVAHGDEVGPASFTLREGEIFGIVGVEGSGKQRFGRLLAGDLEMTEGTVTVDGTDLDNPSVSDMVDAGVGYIPKDRKSEGLLLYQSVLVNTSLAMIRDMNGSMPMLDLDAEQAATADAIEELSIKTPGPNALVHGLSGGNQQKVVIARWLAQDTPVLVMDNVTRGIDVGAKEEVYRLCRELTERGVSIVFIGDELPEVIGMSNRIGVMAKGQFVAEPFDASPGNKPTEEDLIQEMI
ncbi:sugar ABC transporter ATP-binding protein [Haloarcula onubensis]|uniref:Sugar ABC transporter ATP-binding protein n=1 Tax=Haloarcula onubensis TaxID=2950539 RepID=A0ABU2FMD2_9EURY|nr:sugar ABC transporter ATP-binding protein [Halomicroarcula sp. S3CR25-11]MDS0281925.1 sugar ABC transporter ATP-binding protein [Halomicroarcula sp. S3CR25-11]